MMRYVRQIECVIDTLDTGLPSLYTTALHKFKDDMRRFITKLMQKSFLAAYCNINPSV